MNTVGQVVIIDADIAGSVSGGARDRCSSIVVAVTSALAGNFTLNDCDGNQLLALTAGQSGAFAVGLGYGPNYVLSNPADLGLISVSFHPN